MVASTAHRVVSIDDWAPAHLALYEDDREDSVQTACGPEASDGPAARKRRQQSMSFSWRRRPRSSAVDQDFIARLRDISRTPDGDMASQRTNEKTDRPENRFRRVFRRASVSLRGIIQGRPSIHGKEPSEWEDSRLSPPSSSLGFRPATAQSTWRRLRQAASFRHSRLLYTGQAEGDPIWEEPASPAVPVPGNGEQPPIIPHHTGAAAKAAAKAAAASHHNDYYGFATTAAGSALLKHNHWLTTADAQNDGESGIGIAITSTETAEPEELIGDGASVCDEDTVGGISRTDFISQLPVELAIHILSYLDAPGLAVASRVSKSWNTIVSNQHIWRESFLREKTGTYATSSPVKPGRGLGVPRILPENDWREIYRAKEALDKRWKAGKARPVYLNGHSDSIYCLQFDESKIITGSRDKTIRVWDIRTFACRLVIGPPGVLNDVGLLYDNDGEAVHYATQPDVDAPPAGQFKRIAASMPALVSFPTHHKASILCLQYDKDILVTGSSDASCIIYNIRSGYRPIRRLRHHSAAVLDLAFDDKHIVTCSKDISICVWDRATGALLKQLRGHTGPVNAVQMRGNTIVSCSGDYLVKLWNIDTGKNIREFQGHTKGLACSQFSEDGRYIASAGNDMVIRVWDANTGECVREMRAHDLLVRSLHIDSVSGRLVSGSYDQDIKVFDLESGRQLLDFPHWHSSWVLSAKSDYRRIVSTGQDPKILIMDFGAGVRNIEMLESVRADAGNGSKGRQDSNVFGGYI